jgi:hypothetical protein
LCPKENFKINSWGFCVVWSFWYAETRINYPNIPRDVLVKNLLNLFDKDLKKLTVGKSVSSHPICKVIRGYTTFLLNLDSNKSFASRYLLHFSLYKDHYGFLVAISSSLIGFYSLVFYTIFKIVKKK